MKDFYEPNLPEPDGKRVGYKGHSGWFGDSKGHAEAGHKAGLISGMLRAKTKYRLTIDIPGYNAETRYAAGSILWKSRTGWRREDGRLICAGSAMEAVLERAGKYPDYLKPVSGAVV